MPKLVVWTFALCSVLLPMGRANAKPRVDPPETRKPHTERLLPEQQGPAPTQRSDMRPNKLASKTKRAAKPKPPCFAPQVHVVRRRGDVLEHRDLALTFCDGSANPTALDSVSVLARPRDAERPLMREIRAYQRRSLDRGPAAKRRRPEYLTEHVMRVHAELLTRLQKVALRFPDKTIEIVSGHRPDARNTSRHHHGRALDVRVEGVSREALRDFLRSIDGTGVGYYPNSYFVHMDVREKRGYWVDRSGPGETPDYGTWPPTRHEVARATDRVVARAVRDLASLGESAVVEPTLAVVEPALDLVAPTPDAAHDEGTSHEEHSEDALTRDEIARIRAEALNAIEAL
jgi:hypothetical protein